MFLCCFVFSATRKKPQKEWLASPLKKKDHLNTKATVGGMLIANTPPFFTNGFEPVAQVTLCLTDENTSRDMLGAAWLIIALRIHAAKFN